MNYYLPFNSIPYEPQTTGLISKIFKNGINWSSILTNTQKTLNIINQAIPVIKQAKPVINNAKTMFKVMNEFKKVEAPEKNTSTNNIKNEEKTQNNNPTFFL
jgi:hypothetical protein